MELVNCNEMFDTIHKLGRIDDFYKYLIGHYSEEVAS